MSLAEAPSIRFLTLKVSGRWRNNADEVLVKLFFGEERICQNFGSFVFEFGCRKWKRRSLGRNFPFDPCLFKSETIGYKQQSFRAPLFSFGELEWDINFQILLAI
jgi:hypothetical protein